MDYYELAKRRIELAQNTRFEGQIQRYIAEAQVFASLAVVDELRRGRERQFDQTRHADS